MNVKVVYQTDQDGFFVAVAEADESPIEPGVFLIPAGCVEMPPPEPYAGMAARWVDGQWVLETILVAPTAPPEPESVIEPQTPENVRQAFVDAIQLHMDNTARHFGYDDIKSAVTYAEEPAVEKFQLEGRGFRTWRSVIWAYAYDQLEKVTSGQRSQPSIAEFLDELPELVIPLPAEDPVATEPAPDSAIA